VTDIAPDSTDTIVDLLVESGLSSSKGAARRTIGEGGVSVNNQRIDDEVWSPRATDFLHGRWLVLRRGKRNIAGVRRVD
jgi:tyrosyl-tRNA synthetase